MPVRRIYKSHPSLRVLGKTCAEIQEEYLPFLTANGKKEEFLSEIELILPDDLPLVDLSFLQSLSEKCVKENRGFRLGCGFVRKIGFSGKLDDCDDERASVFSPERFSFFVDRLRKRILSFHANKGVLVWDTETIFVDFHTKICEGATLRPFVTLENSYVGRNTIVGEGSVLRNAVVGDDCEIRGGTLFDCTVENGVTVGPYAFLRQNTHIGENCRIGDFVEIKNSVLSDGVKAAHLCYIGDAEVGRETNVGCGTVFCNFDGKTKHRTTVGHNVFIGANTNLVAPIVIGDNAFLAAGGTVTEDVPDDTFVIGRSRSTIKKR